MKKRKFKNSYDTFFIIASFILFSILILLLTWFKDSLFSAKDQISLEIVAQEKASQGLVDKTLEPVKSDIDLFLGSEEAEVKIFYWSDFACSFCQDQESILKNIYDKFRDRVLIVKKVYPDYFDLEGFSFQAARAAACARQQSNSWDYNHDLYGQEDSFKKLGQLFFLDLAQKFQLNIEEFKSCLNSSEVDQGIFENIEEAENLGIMSIPYIQVNDLDFIGQLDQEELETLVEMELEN